VRCVSQLAGIEFALFAGFCSTGGTANCQSAFCRNVFHKLSTFCHAKRFEDCSLLHTPLPVDLLRYDNRRMQCLECKAFLSAYRMATERYVATSESLEKMALAGPSEDPAFHKLNDEAIDARLACEMTREALRIHQEGHPR
jgi:hypothetical protein